MSDRITRQNVEDRVANLNRRMESRGSVYRYVAEGHNGYIGLDRCRRIPGYKPYLPDSVPGRGAGWSIESTVTCGTKREIADFLHAAMIALDDAAVTS